MIADDRCDALNIAKISGGQDRLYRENDRPGSAYFSSDDVVTRILSVFSFCSISFLQVNLFTVNNIDYYTQKTTFVNRYFDGKKTYKKHQNQPMSVLAFLFL